MKVRADAEFRTVENDMGPEKGPLISCLSAHAAAELVPGE